MPHAHAAAAVTTRGTEGALSSDRMMGLAIIAGLPTMLWTGVVYMLAWGFDAPLSWPATSAVAIGIFLFLLCIWAAFSLTERPRPSEH